MSIIWKYLDKRAATIAAIKDYDSMAFIIKSTESKIEAINDKAISSGGMKLNDMPSSVHDPKAGEHRILAVIDQIDILQERFSQAQEYMAWFKPAWAQLTDEERYILKTFYSESSGYGCNAAYAIADKLNLEQAAVYKRKNRALSRLTVLLFGKE